MVRLECNSGSYIDKMNFRSGHMIDSINFRCKNLEDKITYTGSMGGNGGEPRSLECKNGFRTLEYHKGVNLSSIDGGKCIDDTNGIITGG
jgi:Cu2+-containing amine oxidase